MGDVAAILGVGPKSSAAQPTPAASAPAPAPAPQPSIASSTKPLQMNKFTKHVLSVLASPNANAADIDSAPLPPIVPSMVKVNNKYIKTSKKARSWCWAPFSSGARNDGLMLHHWVRAGVEYPEYPFARFNIHLDALNYKQDHDHDNDNDNEDSTSTSTDTGTAFYKEFLSDDNWTRSETDELLELCRIFELRWPVIMDRWMGKFGSMSNKKVEDLQHRYYSIGMILNRRLVEKAAKIEAENLAKALAASQNKGMNMNMNMNTGMDMDGMGMDNVTDLKSKEMLRAQHAVVSAIATSSSSAITSITGHNVNANMQPSIAATNTGTTNQPTFDLETERQRRRILEKIWERSKEEELEEELLQAELKLVETQIRKLKKAGGHILAAAAAAGKAPNVVASGGNISMVPTPVSSRGPSPVPRTSVAMGMGADASFAMLDAQFASTAPIPTPGIPYLQSGRLVNPSTGGQMAINKTTLKRMDQILKELNVHERPLPTKRVCDIYDHVRKGALTLLTLQKAMLKKESEVVSRRNKLEKIAGAAVAREIAAKAEAASAAAAAAAAKEKAAAEKAAKTKPKSTGTKKISGTKKTTKKKAAGDKSGTKRKSVSKKSSTGGKNAGTSSSSTTATTVVAPGATPSANTASAATGATKSSADGSKPKKRARKS